ncbi:HAMP domain-containing histidine kinase [bacterium]|nr:HAMP domain-containing histidine kinase [bacterium]
MNFFTLASPLAYWILVILWAYILFFYLRRLASKKQRIPVFVIPLLILSIDALRTLIESVYFGAWYTSEAGLIPRSVHDLLVQPQYVFIPKIINVAAACLIIVILLERYLPEEERELQRRRNYTRDLEVEVSKRTRELFDAHEELRLANKQLRELDEMKSNFIDITSHELRTPLFCLSGRLYILKNAIPPEHADLMDNIDGAIRSANRLEKLIINTLKLLEGEQYEKRLDIVPANFKPVIDRVLAAIDPFLKLRRQSIAVTGIDGCPAVELDPGKIHDVLINLLMNAIKFTPDDGRIEIEVAHPDAATIEVHVRDEGVGIDPEDQPHIFEKFFTGMDVLTHSSGEYEFLKKGFGLGLAIVKKFVEMHGGRVGMRSAVGKGSDFYFTLPLKQPTAALREEDAAAD